MEEHLRGGKPDLRRAAEGVLSVISETERVAALLADPNLDRWARLAACEAVAGARTKAMLRAVAADRSEEQGVRSAAEDLIEARTIRARGAQAAGSAPDPDRSRDASASDGAVADRSRDASAAHVGGGARPPKTSGGPARHLARLFGLRRGKGEADE